jgi:glycerate 2-kinase
VRILVAPDKFRGTATSAEVISAVRQACESIGHDVDSQPLADGGEGLLDVLGGPNRLTPVTGPLGDVVEAAWSIRQGTAVIEMARASGLSLVGLDENDPVAASTAGTGELIGAALDAGADRIIVGLGGSATTDGGWGAVQALHPHARLKRAELLVACDVTTAFSDAAAVFGPQKGASPTQVRLLTRRLERLADVYRTEFGVDVSVLPGAGAAGGLGGGLAALGGHLISGFDLIAGETDLAERIAGCDLVITGEGFVDAGSFDGKVVGGVIELAAQFSRPVLVVAGEVYDDFCDRVDGRVQWVSLVEQFGRDAAVGDTVRCLSDAITLFFG